MKLYNKNKKRSLFKRIYVLCLDCTVKHQTEPNTCFMDLQLELKQILKEKLRDHTINHNCLSLKSALITFLHCGNCVIMPELSYFEYTVSIGYFGSIVYLTCS